MENNETDFVFMAEDLDLPNLSETSNNNDSEGFKECYLTLIKSIFAGELPEGIVNHQKIRDSIAEVLCTLSPKERDILRLRFGMDDGRQRTLQEISNLFGCTREAIRLIEAKALRKLRHPNRSKHLRELLGVTAIN